MPPAKKSEAAPAPAKKLTGVARAEMFADLATQLSELGGKWDDKAKEWAREPSPTMVAGGADGEAMIKLPGVFSTRIATLDAAIGRGGIPMARITTIAGGESGGKTTIALLTAAECQAMGGVVIYIDNEHKLDLDYAKVLGVDLKRLLLSQPGTIEDGLNLINETILRVHRVDPTIPVFAVLDSINASRSEREYEEDGSADFTSSNQAGLGAQARVMSERLPKMARLLSNRKAALLMISQPRDNIGTPGKNLIAGGNAPRFYSTVVIQLIHNGQLEESGKKIGNKMIAKIIKNQVSAPYKEGEFLLRWGFGVDTQKALIDHSIALKLVAAGSSGWYEMIDPFAPPPKGEEKPKLLKWQGPRAWNKLIVARPELLTFLQDKAREQFR